MRINNNIMAMNTHRQYSINTASVAKSTEKLSSGYRVNRAGDDAAGLAISEKMRAQIRGLRMASKNSSDAISLIQTAEGALQESHNILQRMRELAVQSGSDTNETSIDRSALNAEFQQLVKELNDTASKTKFNDMGVIDGTFGAKVTLTNADASAAALDPTIMLGNTILSPSPTLGDAAPGDDITVTLDSATEMTLTHAGGTMSVTLTEDHFKRGAHTVQFEDGTSFTFTWAADIDTSNATALSDAQAVFDAISEFTVVKANPLTIQTGANQGDELQLTVDRMDAKSLGLIYTIDDGAGNAIDFTAHIADGASARDAITLTNTAVNLVSTQRSKLGALQNRLNYKINNLDTSAENLSAAESRIRDLDMALEMTNFTRNNILTQAATAMLAQANMAPQGVLSLLQ